ncbi:DUF6350 family protein [Flaviflexus huanghaiensis]|uniref:cell division protein PerM n=1 Tax=Flaviflexus huanghaiensis TaxID=1111473 RepID=UPI0015FE1290|nr:DUF6350 family protein [Flaviflexus huanghaiensis]
MIVDRRTHPLRLVAAAVQPILAGWAIVVILGIFSYTLMADSPALGATTWQDVAAVTTGWWLTAFGGSLHFDGVAITLPPLMITLLTFFAALAFIRRRAVKDWIDVSIIAISSGVAVAALGLLAPAGSNSWTAGLGAAVLSLVAILASKNRTDWFATGIFTSAPGRAIYDGFVLARRAVLTGIGLGALGLVTSLVVGWSEILRINDYYIVEWHSGVLMWLFQIAYLPTVVLWSLAYLIGAGFAVGTGTIFSAFGVTAAPLPAIPILGALPQPGSGAAWVVVIVVAILILRGMSEARAFPDMIEVFITGLIQVAATAAMGALLALISHGSIGPQRMSVTGPEAPTMALHSAVFLGVPLVLGMIIGHRSTVAAFRASITRAGDTVRGLLTKNKVPEPSGAADASWESVRDGGSALSPVWPDVTTDGAAQATRGTGVQTLTTEPSANAEAAELGESVADVDNAPEELASAHADDAQRVEGDHSFAGAKDHLREGPTPPTPATAETPAETGKEES